MKQVLVVIVSLIAIQSLSAHPYDNCQEIYSAYDIVIKFRSRRNSSLTKVSLEQKNNDEIRTLTYNNKLSASRSAYDTLCKATKKQDFQYVVSTLYKLKECADKLSLKLKKQKRLHQ